MVIGNEILNLFSNRRPMKLFAFVLAALIIGLIVFVICYWLIGLAYGNALTLGIVAFISGITAEVIRYYFFPKKRKQP